MTLAKNMATVKLNEDTEKITKLAVAKLALKKRSC